MSRLSSDLLGWGAEACAGITSPTIHRVTTTANSGAGSLRAALEASGHRIVVFATGGTFTVNTPIRLTSGNCIVLGSTAPPDSGGVTLKPASGCWNAPLIISASDVIIKHMRFRSWNSAPASSDIDGCTIYAAGTTTTDILFDHCSFSWAADECANAGAVRRITYQWCIFSEGLNYGVESFSGKGFQSSGYRSTEESGELSFYYCLFAHNGIRNPSIGGGHGTHEFVNNVVYNAYWTWVQCRAHNVIKYTGGTLQANVINNYFKYGPATAAGRLHKSCIVSLDSPSGATKTQIHASGNRSWHTDSMDGDTVSGTHTFFASAITPRPTYNITPITANESYNVVLAGAGCRVPHFDAVDARIVEEVRNRTGVHPANPEQVGGWPTLAAGTAWTDSDSDGLPDTYETDEGGDTTSTSPTGTNVDGVLHILAWEGQLVAEGGWSGGEPSPGDIEEPDLPDNFTIHYVGDNDDNGYYDNLYADLGVLYAGDSDSAKYDARACLRFTDLGIPQGYSVEAAYLEMRITALAGSSWSVNIVGEDADDSDAFVGTISDFEDRFETNATTATVADTITSSEIGTWWRSPDISSIVNEILARGSWAAGNALSLCVEDAGSGWDSQRIITFDTYGAGAAPRLLLKLAAEESEGGGESGTTTIQIDATTRCKWRRDGTSPVTLNGQSFVWAGDNSSTVYDASFYPQFDLGSEEIPANATITKADLRLYIQAAGGANFDLDIFAEDDATPTTPIADETDLATRSWCSTGTTWTAASTSINDWITIDITTAMQALVDNQGALSDYIGLKVEDGGSGWNSVQRYLTIYGYYASLSARAPTLELAWTVPLGENKYIRGSLEASMRAGVSK